jgi:peroxiredoxin
MVLTPSTMILELGARAPDFSLPDTDGKIVTLDDFKDARALVVVFMCNHCPYVKHVKKGLAEFARYCGEKNAAVVGINSNDADSYPEDSPEMMAKEHKEHGYGFAYLYDETQEVAKSYRAACTPDFFLFDQERKLVYMGQMDGSRPGNNVPVTGKDIRAALDALLEGRDIPGEQKPSVGCNIKWKAGNEPAYFR